MTQAFHELVISTRGRGLQEFTRDVEQWVGENKFKDGLLTLHLRHTSASLLIQENADPDVRRDLEAFFKRLVPDGDPLFIHTTEGDDDMPAHIRTALTAVNLSIPRSRRPARARNVAGDLFVGTPHAPAFAPGRAAFHRRVAELRIAAWPTSGRFLTLSQ